ncbi:MAG TPA: hypothetical protein EYP29_05045 [Thermoplasmata archaeon]|nr:hypothetical protein [Thermoplasmata archaeon]
MKFIEPFSDLISPMKVMRIILNILPSGVMNFFDGIERKASGAIETALSTLFSLILGKENSLVSLTGWDFSGDMNRGYSEEGWTLPSLNTILNYVDCLDDPTVNLIVDALKPIINEWNTGENTRSKGLGDAMVVFCGILPAVLIFIPLIKMALEKLHKARVEIFTKAFLDSGKAKLLYGVAFISQMIATVMSLCVAVCFNQISWIAAYIFQSLAIGLYVFSAVINTISLVVSGLYNPATLILTSACWALFGWNFYNGYRISRGEKPLSLFSLGG